MKTIKLPFISSSNFSSVLKEQRRKTSCIVRFSFKRFQENKSEKEIRESIQSLQNINLNSWLIQSSIKEGQALYERWKNKPNVIFGGKQNLTQYLKRKITKEEFKQKRLFPLSIQGEASKKGNRLFEFNLINNEIIFKLNRKQHFMLKLPKLRKNYQKELSRLQFLMESKKLPVSFKLTENSIYISFDEKILREKELGQAIKNRYLAFDLNPNQIGYSIIDWQDESEFKLIKKGIFNLYDLNKENTNKIHHEVIEISKRLFNLATSHHCEKIVFENLNIKNKDHGKGKNFNRIVNNDWRKQLLIQNLKKRCNQFGTKHKEIFSAYTSIEGNLIFNEPDAIASSIVISKRGLDSYSFSQCFTLSLVKEQWKQTLQNCKTWKEVNQVLKNLKMKYRVSFDWINQKFSSKYYSKSYVKQYALV